MTMKRALLWCGVIGPVIFTVAYLIEGATRTGYDPLANSVSELSLGDLAWTQSVNFLLIGVLLLAFAVGLRLNGAGWALPVCVAIIGVGLFGAGLFRTDPTGANVERTTLGHLHDLFSLGWFLGLPLACLVAAVRFGRARRIGWLIYSLFTAIVFFVFFVLAGVGFSGEQPEFSSIGGLMQRLCITSGLAWVVALAFCECRRTSRPSSVTSTDSAKATTTRS